ncbi:MAG: type II toxin-antitoxin system RelE/ParE family toxin [Candidatus Margulisiibacteriota bacterium]
MMKIIWLKAAREDLLLIKSFIAKESSIDNARNVAFKISKTALLLQDSPGVGRPGRVKRTRELVIPSIPYIIAYRVLDSNLEILSIIHQARMWPEGF